MWGSCVATPQVMRDPVMASDGHTYERSAILRWLASDDVVHSPMTRAVLEQTLIPNHALRQLIAGHELGLEQMYTRVGAILDGRKRKREEGVV